MASVVYGAVGDYYGLNTQSSWNFIGTFWHAIL